MTISLNNLSPSGARPGRRGRGGFTMIELLIVVFIIGLLAGILVIAVIPLIASAKIQACAQSLSMIEQGLTDWKNDFSTRAGGGKGFPLRQEFEPSGGYATIDMRDGEWLRFILFPDNDELERYWVPRYRIDKSIFDVQIVETFISDDGSEFLDQWDGTIYYRFPGRDHTDETFDEDVTLLGENMALIGKPDLWSYGPDNEDNSSSWSDIPNQADGNDDIGNWFLTGYE